MITSENIYSPTKVRPWPVRQLRSSSLFYYYFQSAGHGYSGQRRRRRYRGDDGGAAAAAAATDSCQSSRDLLFLDQQWSVVVSLTRHLAREPHSYFGYRSIHSSATSARDRVEHRRRTTPPRSFHRDPLSNHHRRQQRRLKSTSRSTPPSQTCRQFNDISI